MSDEDNDRLLRLLVVRRFGLVKVATRAIGLSKRAVAVRLAIVDVVVDRRRRSCKFFDVVHGVALDVRVFWLDQFFRLGFGHDPSIYLSSQKHAMRVTRTCGKAPIVRSRDQVAVNRYMLAPHSHHKSLTVKGLKSGTSSAFLAVEREV